MAKPFVPNLENAQDDIYSKWGNFDSTVAIICGSGWDGLIRTFQTSKDIEYSLISGMSSPTVEGHNGILSLCDLNEKQVLLRKRIMNFCLIISFLCLIYSWL